MDKHKAISDKLREALRGLESPGETVERMLLKTTTTRSASTRKEPTLRELNQRVLRTRAMTRKEREEEAQRLAEARRPKHPDARVMFIEHTRCTACGTESEGISHPLIFLRLRTMTAKGFDPTLISYVPEKEYIESLQGFHLPRLIEHHTTEVSTCPKCFTNAVHSFRGESIESSPQRTQPPSPLGSESSLSETPTSYPTDNEEKSGITPSDTANLERVMKQSISQQGISASTSSPTPLSIPPAPAQPISSLIIEERESVREIGMEEPQAKTAI